MTFCFACGSARRCYFGYIAGVYFQRLKLLLSKASLLESFFPRCCPNRLKPSRTCYAETYSYLVRRLLAISVTAMSRSLPKLSQRKSFLPSYHLEISQSLSKSRSQSLFKSRSTLEQPLRIDLLAGGPWRCSCYVGGLKRMFCFGASKMHLHPFCCAKARQFFAYTALWRHVFSETAPWFGLQAAKSPPLHFQLLIYGTTALVPAQSRPRKFLALKAFGSHGCNASVVIPHSSRRDVIGYTDPVPERWMKFTVSDDVGRRVQKHYLDSGKKRWSMLGPFSPPCMFAALTFTGLSNTPPAVEHGK